MNRLFRFGKKTGNEGLTEQTRNYRNLLRSALSRTKTEYFSAQIIKYQSNSKAFWQTVSRVCGKDNRENTNIRVINPSDGIFRVLE